MSIRRVAARIVLGELADIFDRPTKIVNTLIARGMGYRRQTMLQDVNRALGWAKYKRSVAEVAKPRTGLRETIDSWDMSDGDRYRVYGTSVWFDEESGQMIKKASSYYSDVLSESDDAIQEDFAKLFAEDSERYKGQRFVGFEIGGIEKNVDMPHLRIE